MGKSYRRPRTTQERRVNGKRDYLDYDEYRVHTRASRNFANLVESRDDVYRVAVRDRSWKRYREHQWKPVDLFEGKTLGQLMVEGLEEFLQDLKSGIDLETKYRITRFE